MYFSLLKYVFFVLLLSFRLAYGLGDIVVSFSVFTFFFCFSVWFGCFLRGYGGVRLMMDFEHAHWAGMAFCLLSLFLFSFFWVG